MSEGENIKKKTGNEDDVVTRVEYESHVVLARWVQ